MSNNDHARIYKYVPATTLGASIIIAVVLHYFFPVTILIPFPYNLLGLLIVGLGAYLVLQSVLLLISYNTTFEAGGNPSSLVTKCPYSYSRNPIYLVVNSVIIPFEENRLQKNFDIEYERYKRSVRRWL